MLSTPSSTPGAAMADVRQLAPLPVESLDHLNVALERDGFVRTLLRHLSGTLTEVVGLDEAAGFLSVVGQRMGEDLEQRYRSALGVERLSALQVAAVLVDLKRRIQGDFFVVELTPERIVLGNRACPFGESVRGRPALCMMTSNVFGVIASENLGYARVVLDQTIAAGAPGCRVVMELAPPEGPSAEGREYVRPVR